MKNSATKLNFYSSYILIALSVLFILPATTTFTSAKPVQILSENITYTKLRDSLGYPGQTVVREYQFDFGYLSEESEVLDVDVRIDLTHTWTQDVRVYL